MAELTPTIERRLVALETHRVHDTDFLKEVHEDLKGVKALLTTISIQLASHTSMDKNKASMMNWLLTFTALGLSAIGVYDGWGKH